MSFDDSRTDRTAADRETRGENRDGTSSVFEWSARQHASKNHGENLNRTSSIFEWITRQQASKSQPENLQRTSSIFERASGQQTSDDQGTRAKSRPTGPATDDKTKYRDPFETRANLSRERRLHDDQEKTPVRPPRSPFGSPEPEPERERLHVSPVAEDPLIGRTLANKYTIERVIGTGSMGTIYRARQIALDKWVSVKILHGELAEQRNFVERFKLEAFSASRLEHPNSLRVLDFGEDENLLYLVMEYVEADDLLTIMQREWPLKDARIVQIMCQALAGLAKAHEAGIVHRDIKPENILVLRGTDDEGNATDVVKVCDFGIAKMAGPSSPHARPFAPHLTTEGLVVGTPDYMSPEQARGDGVDGRSDLYSIGVVLYHLLAGRPPFVADTPLGIAIQHVSELPPPPSRHRAVNPVLESICLRAMSKRPADRFQTAREMRRALRSALAPAASGMTPAQAKTPLPSFPFGVDMAPPELPASPRATPSAPSWPNWVRWAGESIRRRPIVAAAALVTVVTLALAAMIFSLRGQDASSGSGNVVRTATVALAPTAPTNTASSNGSVPALTQPPAGTPSPIPVDPRPPAAAFEPELRAPAAVAPSPAPRR